MAVSELATMDTTELAERLAESRKELFNLRFQLATGQLDNTARLGQVRKDVARVLTVLRQRELAELDELAGAAGTPGVAGAPGAPLPGSETDDEEEA